MNFLNEFLIYDLSSYLTSKLPLLTLVFTRLQHAGSLMLSIILITAGQMVDTQKLRRARPRRGSGHSDRWSV